jgi:hypothetical protein
LTGDEVEVVGGPDVAVHADGEPTDEDALVRAE